MVCCIGHRNSFDIFKTFNLIDYPGYEYGESRSGTTPVPDVSIQLKLVETSTGLTVWAASDTKAGASFATRMFGVGGESPIEAARTIIRSQLETLLTE